MSTPTQNRARPVHEVTLATNSDGLYYDGHDEPTFVEDREALAFHHVATANGWEHSSNRTPYENLKAALEATSEYQRQRPMIVAFAFAFIRGLGLSSTPRALDALAKDDDVRVLGRGGVAE